MHSSSRPVHPGYGGEQIRIRHGCLCHCWSGRWWKWGWWGPNAQEMVRPWLGWSSRDLLVAITALTTAAWEVDAVHRPPTQQ